MYLYFIVAIFILFLMMQNKTRGMNKSIEKLVRQSARYATAAQQDKSPVIAVLHANFAKFRNRGRCACGAHLAKRA